MTIASQSREDGHLVDLQLLEAHEEVVNVAVLALHDDLCEHSGQLFLFGRDQSRHGHRAHSGLDEWSHDELEDLALLQDEVMRLLLGLVDQLRC